MASMGNLVEPRSAFLYVVKMAMYIIALALEVAGDVKSLRTKEPAITYNVLIGLAIYLIALPRSAGYVLNVSH